MVADSAMVLSRPSQLVCLKDTAHMDNGMVLNYSVYLLMESHEIFPELFGMPHTLGPCQKVLLVSGVHCDAQS